MNTGGVHVGNLPSNLSVTVLTKELVLLQKKSKFLNLKILHFAIVSILEKARFVMVPIRPCLRIKNQSVLKFKLLD